MINIELFYFPKSTSKQSYTQINTLFERSTIIFDFILKNFKSIRLNF